MCACSNSTGCSLSESGLDNVLSEYIELGAIPHCFFPELAEKKLVVALNGDLHRETLRLYSSPKAFYENNPDAHGHVHVSLVQLVKAYQLRNVRQLYFVCENAKELALMPEETGKLLENALALSQRADKIEENLEIEEGKQIIFSTPDPELPDDFLHFLGSAFLVHDEVAAVYAFETTESGKAGNLVIAVEPSLNADHSEIEKLSILLIDGADRFLHDRDQIDFLVIDDEELLDIVKSVSPEIKR
ncbi:MAG: hypothetical protein Kow0029_08580 [Candidatus Rifleibacteriota bacterium]